MKQTIKINDKWQIVRLDPKNWQIQHWAMIEKGKNAGTYEWQHKGYYATLRQAIFAMPDKMLDETANGTLKDVKESMAAIRSLLMSHLSAV